MSISSGESKILSFFFVLGDSARGIGRTLIDYSKAAYSINSISLIVDFLDLEDHRDKKGKNLAILRWNNIILRD